MKKFTFMLLAAFIAVAAMANGPQKCPLTANVLPAKAQLGQKLDIKQAPREMVSKALTKKARAPKKAEAVSPVGDYTWDYLTSDTWSTDLESLETSEGSVHVVIAESKTTEGGYTITGMFPNGLEATVESDETGNYLVIADNQTVGTSDYGDYTVKGLFYYEGDEEYEAGWYYTSIYGLIKEDGSIYFSDWFITVLTTGDYAGSYLTPLYVEGSTLTPADPLTVVTPPEGLITEEYALTARNYDDDADVTGSVFIGFDYEDVYIQGLCTWIPEAWVKGTLDGTTITFPYGQYFGNSYDYDMFLNVLFGEDVVFTYDAEAGTLTAQNDVFLVDNSSYYFDSYRGCVLKKVTEKAVMPANPEITNLEETSWGWRFNFNVPNVDVNGDPLASSKLYYKIYTDIEREIAPLTFTPETHTYLTENITEIPYGFTEEWDIYSNRIYLNDLYSEDWNKIGIQSIYYGGGETNATEIQWFDIKPYETLATFDFNKMDVPVSATGVTDGDITEATTLEEGNVALTISTSNTSTPNRYWSTTAGPQLRVYGGTLTFSAAEGYVIAKIVFNHNGKWGAGNSADSGEITNDANAKAATWTGSAQTVVVTIAANTQINSIDVILAKDVATQTVVVSEAGYATVVAEQALDFTGLDVQAFTCEAKETYVHLKPITVVPAGTAVVVKAAAGSYDVPLTTEAGTEQANDLVAATEAIVADGTQYILADGAEGVGFYKATPETTIAAGKGYIVKTSSVKTFYGFDADDATGISGINVADENAVIYNVAGQRLSKAQKGINIINGKKVLK